MIHIQNLNYAVGGRPIFSDFEFNVEPGEKVLIRGRSGRGKTSLLKLIMGFVIPEGGKISIQGRSLDQAPISEIRRDLFYLSQDIDLMDGPVDLLIREICQAQPGPMDVEDGLAREMEFLELPPSTLGKQISELSGGERQRLGLLLGFLLNRPVWLLDEPTAALDDELKVKIAHRVGLSHNTVVVISHDNVWRDVPGLRMERWS